MKLIQAFAFALASLFPLATSAGALEKELRVCKVPDTCVTVTGPRTSKLGVGVMWQAVSLLSPGCHAYISQSEVNMKCGDDTYVVRPGTPSKKVPLPEIPSLVAKEKSDIVGQFVLTN